jgi:hypothetical protein
VILDREGEVGDCAQWCVTATMSMEVSGKSRSSMAFFELLMLSEVDVDLNGKMVPFRDSAVYKLHETVGRSNVSH